MAELFNGGDAVPREWFSKLDNVESVTFLCPCLVETTATKREIRKAQPALDGAMVFFDHVKGSSGEMTVEWDRETIIFIEGHTHDHLQLPL